MLAHVNYKTKSIHILFEFDNNLEDELVLMLLKMYMYQAIYEERK